MRRVFLFLLLATISVCGKAQLSQSEQMKLANTVKQNYELYKIEGASLYKTSSGYQVLVTVASVPATGTPDEQNRQAQVKATRLASEFLSGAVNSSVSIFDSQSSSHSSKEELSDKIIQSSMAQIKAIQPLFKMEDGSQSVFAYFLVISQTAAKNGIAGVLSIIPGVGQFYKGSTGKGIMFMSLGAASVAGIIVCECTRSSYANKAVEQPKYMKEYNTKADKWATGRNICIGVGGAVCLWSMIDAFTTKSAKRKVVINKNTDLTIKPVASMQDIGVGFTFNFK